MNKKSLFVLVFTGILLACCAQVSAISSDLKTSYAPQETMIIEVSGNILAPIMTGNVEFLRGHVAVPLEYDVKRLGDKYYIWAIAPLNENNYTLYIHDISTTVSGKTTLVDYSANFSVLGNATDYYVNPGFVYALGDFDILVQLNEDKSKEIDVKFTDSTKVTLKPGQNKLTFSIASIESTGTYGLNIGRYTLPVYAIKEGTKNPIEIALPNLRFKPRMIESTVVVGKGADYPFYIINAGGQDIKNLTFGYNKNIFVIAPESRDIKSGETKDFVISLKNPMSSDINEMIYARGEGFSINMSLIIKATTDTQSAGTPYLTGNFSESEQFYCRELNGAVCSTSETCTVSESVKTIDSLEGNCCLGPCAEKSGSLTTILIGIIIIAILAGAGYFIWKRYKTLKPHKDILAERISEIEKK